VEESCLFGVVSGLTLGIRIGGVFLFGYFGLALLWNYWRVFRSGSSAGFKTFIRLLALPVVHRFDCVYRDAGLLAVAATKSNSISNPGFDWNAPILLAFTVLYRGQFIVASDLPADYILRYLAISLPELLLLLLLAGILVTIGTMAYKQACWRFALIEGSG